jgi:hypothetical protein
MIGTLPSMTGCGDAGGATGSEARNLRDCAIPLPHMIIILTIKYIIICFQSQLRVSVRGTRSDRE